MVVLRFFGDFLRYARSRCGFWEMEKKKASRKSCHLFVNYKKYCINYVLPSISQTPQSCAGSFLSIMFRIVSRSSLSSCHSSAYLSKFSGRSLYTIVPRSKCFLASDSVHPSIIKILISSMLFPFLGFCLCSISLI